jgi:hypothetical protein
LSESVAVFGLAAAPFRDPNWIFGMAIQIDKMVLLVTGGFAIVTTLAFGLLPAWRAGRSDPTEAFAGRLTASPSIQHERPECIAGGGNQILPAIQRE